MELMIMIDAFRRSSAARITAVLPYYGYARQDRKDKPRVPISAKLVANVLSAAGTNRVLTMDLHKAQIQGFFDIPVDHLFAAPVIIDYLARLDYAEPDDRVARRRRRRARARLRQAARRRARRSSTSGARDDGTAEVMNVIGDVEGRTCIIQDDIIDTAGTITKAATALKANGAARVIACAVHGVLSGPAIERIEKSPIDKLIVTNTIPLSRGGRGVQQDRRAVGGAAARPGDQEHSRGDVGLFVVRVGSTGVAAYGADQTKLEERYGSNTRSNSARHVRQERSAAHAPRRARCRRCSTARAGEGATARRRRLRSIRRRC